jgi:hypothetical protein
MFANATEAAMAAFIVAIIVAGFFGPWVISVMLGAVCVGCIGYKRMTGGGES